MSLGDHESWLLGGIDASLSRELELERLGRSETGLGAHRGLASIGDPKKEVVTVRVIDTSTRCLTVLIIVHICAKTEMIFGRCRYESERCHDAAAC